MSDFNLIVWLWQRLCLLCRDMKTSMHVLSRFSYYIHYINWYLSRNFIIDGYVIFLSLLHTISSPWTMSAYDLLLNVYHTFLSMMYYVFSSSVYTLYFICSPSVSTLDAIPFFWASLNHIYKTIIFTNYTSAPTLYYVKWQVSCTLLSWITNDCGFIWYHSVWTI